MTQLDPDPLHVPEPPHAPWNGWRSMDEPAPSRRSGCLLWSLVGLGLWAALLLAAVAVAAPRSAPQVTNPYSAGRMAVARTGAPHREASKREPKLVAAGGAPLPRAGVGPEQPILAAGTISGLSTWYRWHVGQAAAGPALRAALGSHWRGSVVRVCARSCVRVTLTDWCLCGHGRVIDLDSRAFARLAPLSVGVLRVTILSGATAPRPTAPTPTAPNTDAIEVFR